MKTIAQTIAEIDAAATVAAARKLIAGAGEKRLSAITEAAGIFFHAPAPKAQRVEAIVRCVRAASRPARIDHSKCAHVKTPAAARACRKLNPPSANGRIYGCDYCGGERVSVEPSAYAHRGACPARPVAAPALAQVHIDGQGAPCAVVAADGRSFMLATAKDGERVYVGDIAADDCEPFIVAGVKLVDGQPRMIGRHISEADGVVREITPDGLALGGFGLMWVEAAPAVDEAFICATDEAGVLHQLVSPDGVSVVAGHTMVDHEGDVFIVEALKLGDAGHEPSLSGRYLIIEGVWTDDACDQAAYLSDFRDYQLMTAADV